MPVLRWPPLSEFDPILVGTRQVLAARLTLVTMVAVLMGVGWGFRRAMFWVAWALFTEAWMWVAAGPAARGQTPSRLRRLSGLAASVASVFTWLALAQFFWMTPGEAAPFIALSIWAVLMVNAISFAFRSTLALAVFFGPVALASVLTPVISPRFGGAQQVMAECGVAVFALYAGLSAYREAQASRALKAASQEADRAQRAAEDANAAKSDFLATMSHEIRTPLNGVIGLAQAMAHDELPEAQRERLAVIRRSGETLLSLLNDLLDLSRIESGRLVLEDGVVDIEALARGAGEAFAALAADKDIHIELEVAPEARGLWRGDPTRIRQILHNLVSNAVKFTERGVVTVRVGHDGARLVLEVADTGPGVPPEQQATLFDRFVQADASTTRQYGGSGLGLAICRELAELLGGEIALASAPGEGSTFTARLPLARAAAEEDAASSTDQDTPEAASPTEGLPLRILAAEDNPTNQVVIQTLLSQLGAEVQVVDDGQAAVEAYADGRWDVVLMDVQMPRMDGPTATVKIRRIEEARGLPRTPILALTANVMAHQAEEYLAAGMDAVVPKPIQLGQLVAALEAALAQPPSAAEATTKRKAPRTRR